jgi:hypothetical protein
MDKYVVRGKICDETKERKAKTKSLRQTRIEHGSKVVSKYLWFPPLRREL